MRTKILEISTVPEMYHHLIVSRTPLLSLKYVLELQLLFFVKKFRFLVAKWMVKDDIRSTIRLLMDLRL